jgi:hypothetical protein
MVLFVLWLRYYDTTFVSAVENYKTGTDDHVAVSCSDKGTFVQTLSDTQLCPITYME